MSDARQDIVTDQNLKNGMGSVLEFCGYAVELASVKGAQAARDYLKGVARDIITGRGRRAPNPAPVAPQALAGESGPEVRLGSAGPGRQPAATRMANMETQPINLPDALRGEAVRINQLLLNVGHWLLGSGATPTRPPADWPAPGAVVYDFGHARIELLDVHVRDFGQIDWSGEQVVRRRRESEVVATVRLLEGESFTRNLSHTFAHATSLEESTARNFETEIEAHLGSYETPAGFSAKEKVGLEFGKKFGSEDRESDTISDTLTLSGPLARRYSAYRDSVVAQRTTRCQPLFDYRIRWTSSGQASGGTATEVVEWADKAEFLRFIRGLADDGVGQVHTTLSDGNPYPASHPIKLAPYFRDRAQPNGEIPDVAPRMEWTDDYQGRLELGFESEDL